MCGIVGFINKRWEEKRPAGATLLSMLQALSCRGPDSAGVAVYGPPQPFWVLQIAVPADAHPRAAEEAVLDALRDIGGVVRHELGGAYLRVEVLATVEPAALEKHLLARVPGVEIVS